MHDCTMICVCVTLIGSLHCLRYTFTRIRKNFWCDVLKRGRRLVSSFFFPQYGFCTSLQIWDELNVAWRTGSERYFIALSGVSKRWFLWTCSKLIACYLLWQLPRRVSSIVPNLPSKKLFERIYSGLSDFHSFLVFKTFISRWPSFLPTFGFTHFFSNSFNW